MLDVPRQANVSGDASGRQRRQGRKPASCAAAALGRARSRAQAFLADGRSEPLFDESVAYGPTNALFPRA